MQWSDRDGGSGEGQRKQHEEGDDLVGGIDVGQAQAPVVADVAGAHGLENVRQLHKVEAHHRRHQDGELDDVDKRNK